MISPNNPEVARRLGPALENLIEELQAHGHTRLDVVTESVVISITMLMDEVISDCPPEHLGTLQALLAAQMKGLEQ